MSINFVNATGYLRIICLRYKQIHNKDTFKTHKTKCSFLFGADQYVNKFKARMVCCMHIFIFFFFKLQTQEFKKCTNCFP